MMKWFIFIPLGSSFPPTRMSNSLPVFTLVGKGLSANFFGPGHFSQSIGATQCWESRGKFNNPKDDWTLKNWLFWGPSLASYRFFHPSIWRVLPILRGTKKKHRWRVSAPLAFRASAKALLAWPSKGNSATISGMSPTLRLWSFLMDELMAGVNLPPETARIRV